MQTIQLKIDTKNRSECIDVTPMIAQWIETIGATNGIVLVRTLHTTTAIVVNEHEAGFLDDLLGRVRRLVPEDGQYVHDDFSRRPGVGADERVNGFAHVQASLLGSQILVPVRDGKLALGRWQSVIFVELDGPRNARTIECSLIASL